MITTKITYLKNSVSAIVVAFALMLSEQALAGGLTRAKGIFDEFKTELLTIIPVLAVIVLILFAIGYAAKLMEKETFVRWAIGIIIAGSAAEITALFFN